jgi:hypothetical protein
MYPHTYLQEHDRLYSKRNMVVSGKRPTVRKRPQSTKRIIADDRGVARPSWRDGLEQDEIREKRPIFRAGPKFSPATVVTY